MPTTQIKAKTIAELIIEGANLNTNKVKVEWLPAYDPDQHQWVEKYPELAKTMKTPKTDILDTVEDCILILELLSNKDVNIIDFIPNTLDHEN